MRLPSYLIVMALLCACAHSPEKKTAEKDKQAVNCDVPELGGPICFEPVAKEISVYPLGSIKNPIRVDGPIAQKRYLQRLICPDGNNIENAHRYGNSGIGPYGFIVDIFIVRCGSQELKVYMDMYHKGYEETRAAAGFGNNTK